VGEDAVLDGRVRLAELVASLSLATDLGTGQPLAHALRTCLLSLELTRRSGVGGERPADVYYVALLRFVGCTSDASETAAAVGGDEMGFNAGMAPALMGTAVEQVRALAATVGEGLPAPRRVARVAVMLADPGGARRSLAAHCEAAQLLSSRIGVGPGVTAALERAYERWDGKGLPAGIVGDDVPEPIRVVVVARDVELWVRLVGLDDAVEVIRRRSGRAYDPSVAAAFLDDPRGLVAVTDVDDPWHATLEAEPAPWAWIGPGQLEGTLSAFADFVDLASPWLRGHSPGVAQLAAAAGTVAGLSVEEVRRLRLAGLVHDLGRVGVPTGIWDHPGPLTVDARERVRLHPYLTERILDRSDVLAPLARIAACHHERADGSGYHRGARGPDLSRSERLLAAADAYQALTEARPHRPPHSPGEAGERLRRDARSGLFDPSDIEAVLVAAGHEPSPAVSTRPAHLTDREIEVLRLIARGRSNREVAAELVISAKTVGTHVEHIYAKAGVTTRAGATLFAMQHGLL
jgi:HD-GYP domain-containing protein (c-di-GMP phosphodiesterase class II)